MIDPSKDKLAYFKDNFQSAEDEVRQTILYQLYASRYHSLTTSKSQETFDASRYYYQREDFGT